MQFSQEELNVLQNNDFLITKASALTKIQELLTETREQLNRVIEDQGFQFHFPINHTTAKISKGENYELLPYQILDFPAYFKQNDTFAFRTMFWWGNFFSATLHLEGPSLDTYRSGIISNLDQLIDNNTFICIGNSPWEYHYREDNYKPLETTDLEFIEHCQFLKLSKKLDLSNWKDLPGFSSEFLELVLKVSGL